MLAITIIIGLLVFVAIFFWIPGSIGRALVNSRNSSTATDLEKDLLQRSQGTSFSADKIFLRGGGGMAFDTKNSMFYVGTTERGKVRGGIYSITKLIKYGSGHDWLGKHQKFFLDLTVDDIDAPAWRLWFGGDHRSLAELTSTIDVLTRREVS